MKAQRRRCGRPSALDPDRARFVAAMRAVLAAAIAALAPRDRMRLACYYAQEMTLAQIGTLTREHEATVSRALAKTRKVVREDVERRLRDDRGFSKTEIEECFGRLSTMPATSTLMSGSRPSRKESEADRSMSEAAEGAESAERRPS